MAEINKLTDTKVKSYVTSGAVKTYGDGSGLFLRVTGKGTASWIFRAQIQVPDRDEEGSLQYIPELDRAGKPVLDDEGNPKEKLKTKGKVIQKGIGPLKGYGLAAAREAARKMHAALAAGVNHAAIGAKAKKAEKAGRNAPGKTFRYYAERYIDDREQKHTEGKKRHRSAKHMAQWPSTLKRYVYPVIGDMLPKDIGYAHIVDVANQKELRGKDETKYRVVQRIKVILDEAAEYEHAPDRFNPAARYGLKLGRDSRAVEHHAFAPVDAVPAIYAALKAKGGVDGKSEPTSALALRWTILTACRSSECRGALWQEIDSDMWAIPASRMKAGKPHDVWLGDEAQAIRSCGNAVARANAYSPAPKVACYQMLV